MAGEARDEEATWRELVAQYGTPAAADGAVPWPVREELSSARQAPPGEPDPAELPAQRTPQWTQRMYVAHPLPPAPPRRRSWTGREAATGDPGTGREAATGDPGTGRAADANGQAAPRTDGEDPGAAQPPPRGWDPVPGVIPAPPQTRIVRPAAPVPLPPTGDDEHYVPPVPPPLPQLDPMSKGAWAALFGGPGYLLLAVLLGWVVPSWAAFCAVGAFVGGFATLVVRMGDRPPGDSGPNDGAVV